MQFFLVGLLWFVYKLIIFFFLIDDLNCVCMYVCKLFYFFLKGDGCMDSFGYCVKYCIYFMMENDSKKIIVIEIFDKREVGKKSINMEKVGFQRVLEDVRFSNNVIEVVIDVYLQIGVLMSMLNFNICNRINNIIN